MQHHDPVGSPVGEEDEGPSLVGESRLGLAENVLATLPVDLDHELRFSGNSLVLTDRRLLFQGGGSHVEWPLDAAGDLSLHLSDHAGVGTLELVDGRPGDSAFATPWCTSLRRSG